MPTYRSWKTGEIIEMEHKEINFALSGEKILLKVRPPTAKRVKTD